MNAFLRVSAVLLVAGASLASARADRIHLKDGRVLEGEVVEEKEDRVRVKMRLGAVWIDRDEIERIEKTPSPREIYRNRRGALDPGDAEGWLDLADFCLAHDFRDEAERCLEAACRADPDLDEARERLERLRADNAVNELLAAEPTDLPARIARLAGLEDAGRLAVERALRARARAVEALARDPRPVQRRLARAFDRLRRWTRNTVMNERLYTDEAEETKQRVRRWVETLRRMLADPGDPEFLALHPPLKRSMDEGRRLQRARETFFPPGEVPPGPLEPALEGLRCVLEAEGFPWLGEKARQAGRDIRARNERTAKSLGLGPLERAGIRAVNDYRERMGLNRLRLDPALQSAASGHSREMDEKDFFAHDSPMPARRTPYRRMAEAGYDFRVAGENIARKKGGLTAREALDAWIDSPGHHRNLLQPGFEDLGLGVSGIYWTLDMGRKRKK